MQKLTIWTSSDTNTVSTVFAGILRSHRPNVPDHTFLTLDEAGLPPDPSAGDIVLVCGTKPLDVLRRAGIVPKNRTVSSMREKFIASPLGGHWLTTHDPNAVTSDPTKADEVMWDVRLAVRMLRTGSANPVIGTYRWVNDYQPMIDWIDARFKETGKAVDVSCDTETMGFYPWYPDKDIVSISFTAQPNTAEVLYLGPQQAPIKLDPTVPLFNQIQWLLTSPKVKLRMANGKYDLVWIAEKWGIECTNFKFDTMLTGTLLDENRSNSLSFHAKTLTDMGGYDATFDAKYDKGAMETIPAGDGLLTYAGGDTDATHRVADVLRDELTDDPHLTAFYMKVLHPASRSFEKIERRGVHVDQEKYEILRQDVRKVIDEQYKTAVELLPNKMRIKYRDRIEDQLQAGKSPMLPSILQEFFFSPSGLNLKPKLVTEKTGAPSMAKSHLRQFANVPEASAMVEALTQADGAMKTLTTFVDGFLKHLRPDGKFHTTYFLGHAEFEGHDGDDSGTVTGRLSAKNPPFQVIPKKTKWAKRIRECFPAPHGKVMLSVDFSQGELRVIACWAPEPTMIHAYQDDLDLHAVTGAKLAQVDLAEFLKWKDNEDDDLAALFEKNRGNAKPANFGLCFGMQVDGFISYSWANYGIRLTYEEGEAMRNAFFQLYPGLLVYHDKQKAIANMAGRVVSPLGRIRHLPMIKSWDREVRSKAQRQAINSPIQSCLTDMMIWAIALIDDAYPGGEIETVGVIHDALVAYIPAQDPLLWAGRVVEIMSNLPFDQLGWKPQLKFTVDAEIGPNLAALKKVKVAS